MPYSRRRISYVRQATYGRRRMSCVPAFSMPMRSALHIATFGLFRAPLVGVAFHMFGLFVLMRRRCISYVRPFHCPCRGRRCISYVRPFSLPMRSASRIICSAFSCPYGRRRISLRSGRPFCAHTVDNLHIICSALSCSWSASHFIRFGLFVPYTVGVAYHMFSSAFRALTVSDATRSAFCAPYGRRCISYVGLFDAPYGRRRISLCSAFSCPYGRHRMSYVRPFRTPYGRRRMSYVRPFRALTVGIAYPRDELKNYIQPSTGKAVQRSKNFL
ncbi:hypothetical protein AVEN_198349-1 [Araneus ventricosus]|uniref:Uncharacterized protein n=1 Tax=Araneus ventricosus TaxID=182803 RepID=A0A4Y2TBV7_ARAVE|nr:hypothetical protein AVEN_198349-1 [Araneus ventricosus]